jgi:hypothetical protein
MLQRYPGGKRTGFANEYWLGGILDAVRKIRRYELSGSFGDNEHQFELSFGERLTNQDDVPLSINPTR